MPCFQFFQSCIFCSSLFPALSRQILANCPLFIDLPAAFRCCLSSEDTHTTMQAAYARYFLSFIVYSRCALLPKYVINFILQPSTWRWREWENTTRLLNQTPSYVSYIHSVYSAITWQEKRSFSKLANP